MEKIGTDSGIEITRRREGELHPDYKVAWDKRAHTLALLVGNCNALITEAQNLRDDLNAANNRINVLNSRVTTLENMPPFPQ